MESESGAKIAIRGKGSVKEGKGRTDAAINSNLEEDLHCLVMADSEEKVAAAIAAIEKIIETAASIPEGQNELKRNQLRMLATLNGTLRDDEGQACQNCGEIGHRKYDCPQMRTFSANVVCHRCGQAGHFAKDCKVNLAAQGNQGFVGNANDLDKEYQDLMAEVGGGGGGGIGYGQPAARIENQPWQQPQQAVASVAPWKQSAPWAQPQAPQQPAYPPAAPGYSAPPPPGLAPGSMASFGAPPSLGAPPGLAPPGLAPGMGFPGVPPPPPPGGNSFPPPPGGNFPPPPPTGMYPPPPPPQ